MRTERRYQLPRWLYCSAGALLLLCAIVCLPLSAASFDCKKAKSKVEKMICADVELSNLDEDLSILYETALKSAPAVEDRGRVKSAQRKWLKKRNSCQNASCVKARYSERRKVLSATTTALAPKETPQNYPPYPEAWDMKLPLGDRTRGLEVRTARLKNGDVIFGYVRANRSETRVFQAIPSEDLTWTTFFSRQVVESVEPKGVRLPNGTLVAVERQLKTEYPGSAMLSDGTYLVSSTHVFHDCFIGPAKNLIDRYVSKDPPIPPSLVRARVIPTKVVFLLLDRELTWTGAEHRECEETEHKLSVKVAALAGEIVPLADGGFLLVDTNIGLIVRFNADLTTRSRLQNNRLFVFDFDRQGSYLFVDRITGKAYATVSHGVRMQEVLDDLYNYLIHFSGAK